MNNLWLFITDQAWSRTCFCMLRHKINTNPSPVMINQNGGQNGSNWQKYGKSKDRLYASELLDFSVLFQRDLHTGYDCILFWAIVKILKFESQLWKIKFIFGFEINLEGCGTNSWTFPRFVPCYLSAAVSCVGDVPLILTALKVCIHT